MSSPAACPEELECDYLVIGAGACGMAFVDGLLEQQRGTRVVMVDRQAQPGGHWVVDYSFVALHQPGATYGVDSMKLASDDEHLHTRAELLSYFEQVMSKFLASGRVKYYPLCDCSVEVAMEAAAQAADAGAGSHCGGAGGHGAHVSFQSLVSPTCTYNVVVRRKVVDTTYLNITVPSMRPPPYSVETGVTVVPSNAVATGAAGRHFTIIGAGKTAIDTIVFLQRRGVPAEHLTWVVSGDAWLINREFARPRGLALGMAKEGRVLRQTRSFSAALLQLEREGILFRVDPEIWPTKFRCAIVDDEELRLLRCVRDVVRQGRVASVGCSAIHFVSGAVVPTTLDTVHVDCTANGLRGVAPKPVWTPGCITLQSGFMCQSIPSAVLTATVESMVCSELALAVGESEDDGRNRLLQPVPHPENSADFIVSLAVSNRNAEVWMRHRKVRKLVLGSHVFMFSHLTWLGWLRLVGDFFYQKTVKANLQNMHREEFGAELYLAPEAAIIPAPGQNPPSRL